VPDDSQTLLINDDHDIILTPPRRSWRPPPAISDPAKAAPLTAVR